MEEFPRSLREFDEQFATGQACRDYLFRNVPFMATSKKLIVLFLVYNPLNSVYVRD